MESNTTEDALVKRAIAGDTAAFGLLVERYRQPIYALVFHYVRDFETAQDLAQDAFVQAYLKRGSLRESGGFVRWLQTLSRNLCLSWLRRHSPHLLSLEDAGGDEVPDPRPAPHQAVEIAHREATVRDAIARLPEKQRLAITLFYLGGMSYQEMSQFLGESVNAIESRLHRARAKLKESMMTMLDDSLGSHPLPKDFTHEVLQKLRILGVTVGELDPEQPWQINGSRGSRVLIQEENAEAFAVPLPIAAALTIRRVVLGEASVRPMTLETLRQILRAFEVELEQVKLSGLSETGFQAELILRQGTRRQTVSAPGGEGVTLAALMGADIVATPMFSREARRLAPVPDGISTAEAKIETSETLPSVSQAEDQKLRWRDTARLQQVSVRILRLGMNTEAGKSCFIVLGDAQAGWGLPIYCTLDQVASIAGKLREEALTKELPPALRNAKGHFPHDLIRTVLDAFCITMQWLAVDQEKESTYYAVALFQSEQLLRYIDMRPSDGLALAVRYDCPIYLAPELKATALPKDKAPHYVLLSEATSLVMDCVDQNAPSPRILLKPTPEGQCHFEVRIGRSKLLWSQAGGSFEACREDFKFDRKLPRVAVLERAGRKYGLHRVVRSRPQWSITYRFTVFPQIESLSPEQVGNIPRREVLQFQKEFLELIRQKHPTAFSMTIMARRQSHPELEWVLSQAAKDLEAGTASLEVARRFPAIFGERFMARWEGVILAE